MQNFHGEGGNKSTQNELVLLFPAKKERIYLKRDTISGKNMWRWTCVGAINKTKNSLT
jgi:hypothetical protein